MAIDANFLASQQPDTLHVNPAPHGCYASIMGPTGVFLDEVEVSQKTRIGVIAFYVNDRRDYSSYKIVRITKDKLEGWKVHSCLTLTGFGIAKLRDLNAVLSMVDLSESRKTRIAIDQLNLSGLEALIASSEGSKLLSSLSNSSELRNDIVALQAKRETLGSFASMLEADLDERAWQSFFEANTWIFGYGLNYVFLSGIGDALEQYTTGSTFNDHGKRVDGLMRTRAEVSQSVLVEIKKNNTKLLEDKWYRSGCWAVSGEVAGAVTQIQKTSFEFAKRYERTPLTDRDGNDLEEEFFTVEPETFLVVGNLKQLANNRDKVTCFELFRKSLKAPRIFTFDELYQRAKFIVENLDAQAEGQ